MIFFLFILILIFFFYILIFFVFFFSFILSFGRGRRWKKKYATASYNSRILFKLRTFNIQYVVT